MFRFSTTATIEAIDPPIESPGRNGMTQIRRVLRLRDAGDERMLHVTFFGRRAAELDRFSPGDRVAVLFELHTKTYPRRDPQTGAETEHAVMLTFGLECAIADEAAAAGYGRRGGRERRR